MFNFKQTLLYLKTLLKNSKDSFILLGLLIFPILNLSRTLFINANPNIKYLIGLFYCILNIVILFLIFFNKKLKNKLIEVFSIIFSSKLSQNLLFLCLWIEQILLIHSIILVILSLSFTILFLESILNNIFLGFCFQLIFTCGLIYYRLRKSFLNEDAFKSVGVNYTKPYSWATVIHGLNCVLTHKLANTYANLQSEKSLTSTSSSGVLDWDTVKVSTTDRVGVGPNTPSLISNQKTLLNGVVFPFFPPSHRRTLSTRAALRNFGARLWESIERAPFETTGAIFGGSSAALGAAYIYNKDQRYYQLEKEKDQRNYQLEKEKFELDKLDKQKNWSIQEEQLNLQKALLQESKETRLSLERTQNLVMEGKLPPEAVKQWLNPDGTLNVKNQNPGSLGKVSFITSKISSSDTGETERLINLSEWFV